MARFALVDASNLIKRSYHQAEVRWPGDTQAFVNLSLDMVSRIVKEYQPTHFLMVEDHGSPTFRHELDPRYKQSRRDRPGPRAHELLQIVAPHFDERGIARFCRQGYEADDKIATIALKTVQAGNSCIVISKDSDLLQLLEFGIKVFRPQSGGQDLHVTDDVVRSEMGIEPSQIVDYKALKGDDSDDVPRLSAEIDGKLHKVNKTKAAEYLRRFNDLEGLYKYLHLVKSPREQKCLSLCRERAFLSRELVRLRYDVPLDGFDLATTSVKRSRMLMQALSRGRPVGGPGAPPLPQRPV